MKRIFAAVAIPLLLVAETGAAAISRQDLDALALDVWRLRAAFHTLTVMQGGADFQEQLDLTLEDADDAFARLADSAEGEQEQSFINQVSERWERYRTLIGSNTVAELGSTDHYTITDMEAEAQSLSRLLNERRGETSAKGEDLADLAVRLQRLTSEYMFLSAAADGGGAIGTGVEDGRLEFVSAVPDFEQRLTKAQKTWAGNPDISRNLRSVASKWAFIRESLVKFYENSVPFVVQRYSQQMVETLKESAELARK